MKRPTRKGFANLFKSKALTNAIQKVPGELWLEKSSELLKLAKPTKVDRQIKERLLDLVLNEKTNEPLQLSELYNGICTYTNFYNHLLSNPKKIVWLFDLTREVSEVYGSIKFQLSRKLRQIIELPIQNNNGRICHKNIEAIIRLTALVYDVIAKK